MTASLKLYIFLAVLISVNGLNPMEKLQNLKEKSVAAIGQVKYTINAYKAQTQAKLQNMKSYLNYLKNVVYAKAFPYSGKPALTHDGYNYKFPAVKPALTHDYTGYDYKFPGYAAVKPALTHDYTGYDYKFPGYAAVKPALTHDYTGYDYKFPGYYHNDHPYSYVQFQSGPGYYKSGILH